VERPWGKFQQFVSNEQVTVKIITVEPGHRLSLQRHEHRGEMWQILDGPIDITVGDRTWPAQPGELVWVPCGATHRMGNSGSRPSRLLEVAFGHFDEDDIERLEDDYARRAASAAGRRGPASPARAGRRRRSPSAVALRNSPEGPPAPTLGPELRGMRARPPGAHSGG
jgi:mannose-1-phosphate guanylyltransferase/mannose-6-phosphate isomerase